MMEPELNWDRDPFLSSHYSDEQDKNRTVEGKLTDEVIRGITGFWVGRVDSINLIRLHILCNRQGRE